MFSVGLAAMAVSLGAAWLSLRRLVLETGEASDLYAETMCSEHFRMRNRSKWLGSYGLEIEELDDPARPTGCWLSYLECGGSRSFALEKMYPRRGRYESERLRVRTGFPFGLIRAERPISLERHITVFPKVMRVDISFMFRSQFGQVPERQQAGDSEELLRIRDYLKGDNYHHIHWKATAKLGKVMIRDFASPQKRSFSVIFDNSASPKEKSGFSPETFERTVSAVASVVSHLSSHAFSFRFISCDEVYPHRSSDEHRRGVLGHLATVEANDRPHIDLMDWAKQSLRRGDIVLVLPSESADVSPWAALSSTHLHLVDPLSLVTSKEHVGV
jgi:uncharacterized protein (DUF58 family)